MRRVFLYQVIRFITNRKESVFILYTIVKFPFLQKLRFVFEYQRLLLNKKGRFLISFLLSLLYK
jgi:hypothetical protein